MITEHEREMIEREMHRYIDSGSDSGGVSRIEATDWLFRMLSRALADLREWQRQYSGAGLRVGLRLPRS